MYKILQANNLVPKIHENKIEAPAVAKKAEAGQFVVVPGKRAGYGGCATMGTAGFCYRP
jgi:hypothetical protein